MRLGLLLLYTRINFYDANDRDGVFYAVATATAVVIFTPLYRSYCMYVLLLLLLREKKFDRSRIKSAKAKTTTAPGVGSNRGKNNMFAKSLCYYIII